ncbi:MAG: M56 family metallopeptidase [Pyrinomonadaceae bacterium]
MNWYLLETGISNAAISFMIALIAVFVGKTARRPHLAHLLWLLVLAKLLMPAHISFAFDPFPPAPENISSVALAQTELPADSGLILGEMQAAETDTLIFREFLPQIKSFAVAFLPAVWIFGIFAAIVLSIFRVVRFNRLLTSNSESAPESVLKTAFEIADKLELRNIPSIRITNASIAPMVWWVGGKVRVFIPHALIKKLDPGQLRLVIAHELAHVKRRDFLVRWIEWLAGVLFWWNPVVWWAQRNIRANEEICCDSLVLTAIKPKPHEYAASLLSAVESFTESAYRPPAMASEINSGGYLLRRVNMILSGNNSEIKRRMQIAVLAAAALVLPLGLTFAQDKDPDSELRKKIETITKDVKEGTRSKDEARNEIESIKREIQIRAAKRKLDAAVSAGKMSPDEAQRNLEAVRKNANAANKDDDALRKAREEIASALKKGTDLERKMIAKRTLKLKLAYSRKKTGNRTPFSRRKIKNSGER